MINAKFFTVTGEYLYTLPCSSLSVSYELNAVGTFDFKLSASSLRGHQINRLIRMRVVMQVDGVEKASGYVHSLSMNEGTYNVRCNSLMDELTKIRSKTNAKYQDQQLIAILLDLLTYAPDWSLGDITTMIDPLVRTTIDLRGEKRLYSQIIRLVESVPNVYLREAPGRKLDIGVFNTKTYPRLAQIESLNVTTSYVDITRQIESYGGEVTFSSEYVVNELQEQIKYSDDPESNPSATTETYWMEVPVTKVDTTSRTITLSDALAYEPSLATHPNFPIVFDKGVHVVRNVRDSLVTGAGEFTEQYTQIVPSTRENPTVVELAQAGYALWLKTVKELEDRSQHVETWSCKSLDVPADFAVGDRLFIQSSAKRSFRDPFSGSIIDVGLESVSEWFRVPRYSVDYDDGGVAYDFDLSDTFTLVEDNPFLALFEASNTELDPTFSDNVLALSQYAILSATIPTGQVSDCFNQDETGFFEGRTYSIPLGTVPVGAAGISVYGEPFSTQDSATLRLVSPPGLPGTAAIICASVNRGWTIDNTLTVYLLVQFT